MKKKTVVMGLGVSGKGAVEWLLDLGRDVLGIDQRVEALRGLSSPRLEVRSDREAVEWDEVDELILSPGVLPLHRLVVEARAKGVSVVGEAEFALRQMKNRSVAVTGSNGKTTTVLLVAHVLNAAGQKARALGNVGCALSGYLKEAEETEILVVELSSFQLETLETRVFEAAAILNITPNHLNRHASMREYAEAKAAIQKGLKRGGKLFVSKQVAEDFGALLGKCEVFEKEEGLAPILDVRYIRWGAPERQNLEAAFSLCAHFGVSRDVFEKALATFQKPEHRIEYVAEVEGVIYINDSKATSVEAVLHAVKHLPGPIFLLAGGVDKGASYAPWIDAFQGKVKEIIAFGEAAPLMEKELASRLTLRSVGTLEEALEIAKGQAVQGDLVVLSPGCSSYDQFQSYEHRGEAFKKLVRGEGWIGKKPF